MKKTIVGLALFLLVGMVPCVIADTCSVEPVADASATYINLGDQGAMWFGAYGESDVKSFIKFTVPPGNPLQPGTTINSVTLTLWGDYDYDNYTGGPATVYQVADSTWTETGVTYANSPAFGPAIGTFLYPGDNRCVIVDVTAYVLDELSAGRTTISFGADAPHPADHSKFLMYSREASQKYRPILTIDYTPPSLCSVEPVADASATYCNVGTGSMWFGAYGASDVKSFIKFTVPSELPIQSGTVIHSARLTLWGDYDYDNYTGGPATVYQVADSTWTETDVTYANSPAFGPAIGTFSYPGDNQSVALDVTDYVQGEVGAGRTMVSFGAEAPHPADNSKFLMWSRDATNTLYRPSLTIAYTPPFTFSVEPVEDASATYCNLGTGVLWFGTYGESAVKSFIKFTVPPEYPIPAGTVIHSARLTLWGYGYYDNLYTGDPATVYQVADSTWTELGVTYANAPAFGPVIDTFTYPGDNQSVTLDVTAYVQSEVNAGRTTVSFGAEAPHPADNSEFLMWSRDAANAQFRPTLTIDCDLAQVAIPVISPNGGDITEAQAVSITCRTPDATIRYTLDGSDPIESSTIYNGPITVNPETTVKAKAWSSEKPPSLVKTATFSYPRFYIGWWGSFATADQADVLADTGVNIAICYWSAASDTQVRIWLDQAHARGLKVIVEVPGDPNGGHCPTPDMVLLRNYVQQFDNHPAVYGWYIADEPTASEHERCLQGYTAIKQVSSKPVLIAFFGSAYDGLIDTFADCFDEVMYDRYPCGTGKSEFSEFQNYGGFLGFNQNDGFITAMNKMCQASERLGKPWWVVVQGFGRPHSSWRLPTYRESRFMQYYPSALWYCKGTIYWMENWCKDSIANSGDPYPYSGPVWFDEVATPLINEIGYISRAMATVSLDDRVTCNKSRISPLRMWKDPVTNVYYMVGVNQSSYTQNATFTFNIPNDTVTSVQVVTPNGLSEPMTVTQNAISYSLPKYDVVIFKLNTTIGLSKIPGDANNDGTVDVADLGILGANYGHNLYAEGVPAAQGWGRGDFNGDRMVDVGDLGILSANYGSGASGANWKADYAKVFGTAVMDDSEDDSKTDASCSELGLPLVAGMVLMGLMRVNLKD